MNDPYAVLGVAPSATDDEVTRAYRKLAKRYHPDLNPGDNSAAQKMQEVNAAYDQVKEWRKNGDPTGERSRSANPYGGAQQQQQQQQQYGTYENPFEGYDPFGFGAWFGGGYQQRRSQGPEDYRMQAVSHYIRNACYEEALTLLASIPERNAEWYYYSAVANANLGNRITALNHAQEAVRLDPGNMEYQRVLSQLQRGASDYTARGTQHGFEMSGAAKIVTALCLAQCLCSCCFSGMGGGYVGGVGL